MKAVATVEKRPACLLIRQIRNLVVATYKYQDGIEIIVVFFMEVPVIFVRLFSELFVEVCPGIQWFRTFMFRESCFDRGGQVIAESMHNVRH